jgi:hypothetical protein
LLLACKPNALPGKNYKGVPWLLNFKAVIVAE